MSVEALQHNAEGGAVRDRRAGPVYRRFGRLVGVCGLLAVLPSVMPVALSADENTAESTLTSTLADPLPAARHTIRSRSALGGEGGNRGGPAIRSLLDAEEINAGYQLAGPDNLDSLMSAYQSRGLRVNRLSTAWETGRGTLSVGSDWSNFRGLASGDIPAAPADDQTGQTAGPIGAQVTEQITWTSRSGFSIALEKPDDAGPDEARSHVADDAVGEDIESLRALTEGSPNLILSWQGGEADQAGRYKVAALGRKLEVEGEHNGVAVNDSELGWGVNLAGGWRFGDLFAALSVTLGNGIDSLLLKRFGSDVAVSSSGEAETLESISILPSLSYSIDNRSDFHLSLGRYQSDGEAAHGIDTLDTINLGYTWSPWPSTRFGVEVTGKDFDGGLGEQDSAEIKFGAEQRF